MVTEESVDSNRVPLRIFQRPAPLEGPKSSRPLAGKPLFPSRSKLLRRLPPLTGLNLTEPVCASSVRSHRPSWASSSASMIGYSACSGMRHLHQAGEDGAVVASQRRQPDGKRLAFSPQQHPATMLTVEDIDDVY